MSDGSDFGGDIASALVLITTDPESGRSRIGSSEADAVVGGAFLIDLISAGRLGLEGEGRKARVVVLDPTPLAAGPLQVAFNRLQAKKPLKPQDAVARLGKRGRPAVYESLAARGVTAARQDVRRVFPLKRYDVTSSGERSALVTAVRRVLLGDAPADATTGPLVGLLLASDLLKVVVDRPDRKRARMRAEVVSQGDWASDVVREAIKAAQSAVAVAAVAATAGAEGSGS